MKRKHADLAIEYFSDDSAKFQIVSSAILSAAGLSNINNK